MKSAFDNKKKKKKLLAHRLNKKKRKVAQSTWCLALVYIFICHLWLSKDPTQIHRSLDSDSSLELSHARTRVSHAQAYIFRKRSTSVHVVTFFHLNQHFHSCWVSVSWGKLTIRERGLDTFHLPRFHIHAREEEEEVYRLTSKLKGSHCSSAYFLKTKCCYQMFRIEASQELSPFFHCPAGHFAEFPPL